MSHVFISYSHEDKYYIHTLAEKLEQEGFTVWIDDRIDYGSRWPLVIQQQLDACAAFIVVMTPQSFNSTWVQNELTRAMRIKKPLFPLLLEGDVWLAVETTQYINVKGGQLPPPRFFKKLAEYSPPHTDIKPAESSEALKAKWAAFQEPGANDFYAITMYALYLEAAGEHAEAVRQLRRANKLEPRIKNRVWMTTHFEWSEIENEFLERILTDPNF